MRITAHQLALFAIVAREGGFVVIDEANIPRTRILTKPDIPEIILPARINYREDRDYAERERRPGRSNVASQKRQAQKQRNKTRSRRK